MSAFEQLNKEFKKEMQGILDKYNMELGAIIQKQSVDIGNGATVWVDVPIPVTKRKSGGIVVPPNNSVPSLKKDGINK